MLVPVFLVVLLVSGMSTYTTVGTHPYDTDADSGRDLAGGEAPNSYRRDNRAFSPFQTAWKAILRSADEFERVSGPRTYTRKFTKVGSMSDALRDFNSLKPRDIQNQQGTLFGHVGVGPAQTIILDTNSVDTPVLFLTAGKVGTKRVLSTSIIYKPKAH